MKKLLMFAALLLCGGILSAEPTRNGPRTPGSMTIWRTTAPISKASAVFISSSPFIHEIIVSSPATVSASSAAVLTIYGETPPSEIELRGAPGVFQSTIIARIQLSTALVTNTIYPQIWNFDIKPATAITVNISSGAVEDGAPFVSITYMDRATPDGFKVWNSTFITVDGSTHVIARGPVLLHKISVFKRATTANTDLRVHNCHSTQLDTCGTAGNLISQLDISTGTREWDYDILLSSGLVINAEVTNSDIMVFYKTNPGSEYEWWIPHFASGTVESKNTTRSRVVTHNNLQGPVTFGGILNGDTDSTSHIMVFDLVGDVDASTGPTMSPYLGLANRAHRIGHAVGWNTFDFDDVRYEVNTASGMGVRTEGAGQWTIRYRKLR